MATKNQNIIAPDYITILQNPKNIPLQYRIVRNMFGFFGRVAPWPTWKFASRMFFTPKKRRIRKEEQALLDAGETRILEVDNKQIYVSKWGNGSKRVLLLHGWGGNRAQMTTMVQTLVHHGFEVIAFDSPAHGESEGSQTNLAKIIDTINIINHESGGFNYAIGHSFGGAALTVAMDRGLELEKLVTISTPTVMERSVMKPFQLVTNVPDKVMNRVINKVESIMGQSINEVSASSIARSMTTPLLIIHDENDGAIPKEDAIELHENWKNSQLHLTEGLGHRQVLRDDGVHQKIIEFLK